MNKLTFHITGESPLLMHNGQLADPLNKWTRALKEVSSKRAKTDADYEEMARLEYMGGLYINGDGPCIPGEVMEGALNGKGGAARKHKMGKQAAAGLYCADANLEYDGPRDPKELWESGEFVLRNGVKVGTARVMRTRPMFKEWAATVTVYFDPHQLNEAQVVQFMEIAGTEVGLMDWRPKFGRFTVEVLE